MKLVLALGELPELLDALIELGLGPRLCSVRLPVISGLEYIAALAKLGYRQTSQRGSHVRLVARDPVTIPLQRTADVDVDSFSRLL